MIWITFAKIKVIGSYTSYFNFYIEIIFNEKMKIKEIISNELDLNKYYIGHDSEQHSRGFNRRSDTLRNVHAGDTITFKPYNSKSYFMKKYFIIVF